MDWALYKTKVYQIIGAAMAVRKELRGGLLEAIYEEALCLELTKSGIPWEREKELSVFYKGQKLHKTFRMDIVVDDDIIVELKAMSFLAPEHRAQLCNYLRLTNLPVGLLINFGESKLTAERWCFDPKSNECFLADVNMQRNINY